MPKCYQLVGVPASGKSTWVEHNALCNQCVIISTDAYVEQYAKEQGKTYNDVFKEYMPTAVELMEAAVIQARAQSKDIVWDQTNMSVKTRARKFRMLPNYEHIAVVFKTPDADEHARRLASRPGKTIPQPVLDSMAANFEMPTKTEGFTEIWFAN